MGSVPCTKIEKGIDLRKVPSVALTNNLFAVAQATGDPKILSGRDVDEWISGQIIREGKQVSSAELQNRAQKFLEDAKQLLTSMKIKVREVELPYQSFCSDGEGRGGCP